MGKAPTICALKCSISGNIHCHPLWRYLLYCFAEQEHTTLSFTGKILQKNPFVVLQRNLMNLDTLKLLRPYADDHELLKEVLGGSTSQESASCSTAEVLIAEVIREQSMPCASLPLPCLQPPPPLERKDAMPSMKERAEGFERTRKAKTSDCKYGRCCTHNRCMLPWVYKSGLHAGRAGAVCPLFLQRDAADKPKCWQRRVFSDSEIETFPTGKKQEFFDLKNRLRRGGLKR